MNFQQTKKRISSEIQPVKEAEGAKEGSRSNDLFNEKWEVFVVKLDKATGKYIGKVACCALEPV